MSVRELLRTHTSEELTEWMAYEQITGPFGPERHDQLMAILAATVSNANRAKGRPAKSEEFMPKWDRGGRQSWEDMLAAVKTYNHRIGGTDLTAEGGGNDGPDSFGAAGSDRDRHGSADRWRERRR